MFIKIRYLKTNPPSVKAGYGPATYEATTDTSSNDAILQVIPKTDHYVLDGCSLIHRLKWTDGSTYNSIADEYASFTVAKSACKSTTIIGEDTDMLVLLLYHAATNHGKDLL